MRWSASRWLAGGRSCSRLVSVSFLGGQSSLVDIIQCFNKKNNIMARSGFNALSFAVLLAVLEIGSCLRCYQCNTQQDPACGDPFKGSKYLVDCNTQDSVNYNQVNLRGLLPSEVFVSIAGAPRYCHKITTLSGTVVRTCLDVNPADMNQTCRLLENTSKIATVDSAKIKHCSVCDKDTCNGAGATSVSLPLATLALIVSYLFFKQ